MRTLALLSIAAVGCASPGPEGVQVATPSSLVRAQQSGLITNLVAKLTISRNQEAVFQSDAQEQSGGGFSLPFQDLPAGTYDFQVRISGDVPAQTAVPLIELVRTGVSLVAGTNPPIDGTKNGGWRPVPGTDGDLDQDGMSNLGEILGHLDPASFWSTVVEPAETIVDSAGADQRTMIYITNDSVVPLASQRRRDYLTPADYADAGPDESKGSPLPVIDASPCGAGTLALSAADAAGSLIVVAANGGCHFQIARDPIAIPDGPGAAAPPPMTAIAVRSGSTSAPGDAYDTTWTEVAMSLVDSRTSAFPLVFGISSTSVYRGMEPMNVSSSSQVVLPSEGLTVGGIAEIESCLQLPRFVGISNGLLSITAPPADGGSGAWTSCTISVPEAVTPMRVFSWPRGGSRLFGFVYGDGAGNLWLRVGEWPQADCSMPVACASLDTSILRAPIPLPLTLAEGVGAVAVVAGATALGALPTEHRAILGTLSDGRILVSSGDPSDAGTASTMTWSDLPALPHPYPVLAISSPSAFGDPAVSPVEGRYAAPIIVTTSNGIYRTP